MSLAKTVNCPYVKHGGDRIYQGDIFKDVSLRSIIQSENEGIAVEEIPFLHSIILTQDCDLEQDFNSRTSANCVNHDKFLPNLFICPAYIPKANEIQVF